jgi:hypothetical protein
MRDAAFEVLKCAIHTVVFRQHLRPIPTATKMVMLVVMMVAMMAVIVIWW